MEIVFLFKKLDKTQLNGEDFAEILSCLFKFGEKSVAAGNRFGCELAQALLFEAFEMRH